MLRETTNIEEVYTKVLERGRAVVYFTAPWCVPCRQIKPQFARASVMDADTDYYIIDIDESPSVVEKFSISAVPTIISFDAADERRIVARRAAEIVEEVHR
jgi:thioredoxin 1